MRDVLLQRAIKLNRNHKQRKWWQRAVRILAMAVVFCTTYALILPAITMEEEAVCGKEAHVHEKGCYAEQPVPVLKCSPGDGVQVVHSHSELCYDEQNALICTLPEIKEHIHDDSCYVLSQEPVCGYNHEHGPQCTAVETVLSCGMEALEAHVHSQDCTTELVLICGLQESEGHAHTEACGTTKTVLVCTEQEVAPHVHGEACYQLTEVPCQQEHEHGEGCAATETILVCTKTEEVVHTHGEACYQTEQVPCQIPVSEGHAHSDSCYERREVPCTVETQPAHQHTDACYTQQEIPCDKPATQEHVHGEGCYEKQLSCGLEEVKLHTHGEACYDAEQNLICQQPQVMEHTHTEDCLTRQTGETLVCQLEEHTHDDSCYPVEEEQEGIVYICGMGVHTHIPETCTDGAGNLTCTIPEHTHDLSCVVEGYDLTADVETEEQWKASVSAVTLTGNWPEDILAVAQTQLDYKESTKNVIQAEDGTLKGYTRYGAWYGEPYADWNAMFAAFCLHYAGVEDFPVAATAKGWEKALTEQGLYRMPPAYTPKPGDLAFLDFDRRAENAAELPIEADQVAIVAERNDAEADAPAKIKLIVGDQDKQVRYMTYEQVDPVLIGYGVMPAGDYSVKTYAGEDFEVTVTYGRDAALPETVELTVREILPGTEEYDSYYRQSVEAMQKDMEEPEEIPEISFARFFDISFMADGMDVEPAAPVDVQIQYSKTIPVTEEENGVVVHFAKEGVEILNADTFNADPEKQTSSGVLEGLNELFTGHAEQVDTFRFTQDSFSVSGTVVTYAARAVGDTYYYKEPAGLDPTGNTQYLFYTKVNEKYYAIQANASGAAPKEITFNTDGSLATPITGDMLWKLNDTADGAYVIKNVAHNRYLHSYDNNSGENITTGGAYSTSMLFSTDGENIGVKFKSNNDYAQINSWGTGFTVGQSLDTATTFFIAAPRSSQSTYHVWYDGTNGGLMNLYGSDNSYLAVSSNNNVITLPDTWKSPTKYPYKLNGWYDIVDSKYYKPGEQVTIRQNTVFYADWIAANYDIGQNNSDVSQFSVDTNDFITTYVFDYNTLFNAQSQAHIGSISASGHRESWTLLNSGKVPYNNADTLGFAFIDYDSEGEFSYAHGRDDTNTSNSYIKTGIINEVYQASGGKDLMELLFDPNTPVIGKYYAGTGNYLFQYMDSNSENYDGEHDGYYYLDARLNAASYNQSQQRFYVYNYLERTSDSRKDGGPGQYSDILPFNAPNLFDPSRMETYVDSVLRPGYEYDAKDVYSQNNIQYSEYSDAGTNYFFGLRTDIEFFLPNDTNTQDEYGNYGNISTRGEHMIFDFHGDDDVWVFVDGQLVLDIGGMHGVMMGSIDFSTGKVTTGAENGATTTTDLDIKEGNHTMTVYYMERGSSQSNCAIYFNIAPRYDLEITKEDIVTANKLDGAVFSIYNDEAGTSPAQLWDSKAAHDEDMEDGTPDKSKNTFTVVDGIAKCWGISAGKTYYIYETTPPPGYPESDDMIRITLNNRGTATIEATTLHGSNGIATEGFAVIKQDVNDTLKIVALTVTNQKEGDTTEVRVEKTWDEGSVELPQYITVYLTADGQRIGRSARLTEGNGWSYTWTGLPKYRTEGIDEEVVYEVEEVFVPNFITVQGESQKVENYVDWVRVDQMSDSKTFLLVHNGRALTYDGTSFGWMDRTAAELDTSLSAQWSVTTDHDGFHLENGHGYALTYGSNGFYGTKDEDINLNQVVYYLNSRLVFHDHDVYYQFGNNGAVVREDGLAFQLYQKEVLTGQLTGIINKPVDEQMQTFVEVNKVWADGAEKHVNDRVVIHLYADGKDTGRVLTLNAANNWQGSFDDLPYYQDGTETPIVYTVVEDAFDNYVPSYSDPQSLDGRPVSFWQNVESLEASDEVHRISYGGHSLAVDASGNVVSALNDLDDTYQQWKVVNRNGTLILQNVKTNRYLMIYGTGLATTTSPSSASSVTLSNGYVQVNSQYLELSATHAGVTSNPNNIDTESLRVTKWVTTTGMEGTGITVRNSLGYELPETGGGGTFFFTFGGLLMMAGTCVYYITVFGRKRQKGGAKKVC